MLKWIIGMLSGNAAAASIAEKSINWVAVVAAVAPAAVWFQNHKDDQLIVLTYGDAVFWGAIMFVVLKVALYTRSPAQQQGQ